MASGAHTGFGVDLLWKARTPQIRVMNDTWHAEPQQPLHKVPGRSVIGLPSQNADDSKCQRWDFDCRPRRQTSSLKFITRREKYRRERWVEMGLTARGIIPLDVAEVGWKWAICRVPSAVPDGGEMKEFEYVLGKRSPLSCQQRCWFKFDMSLLQAADANSSGQTQSSPTSQHMFSVSVEDHNFNSTHKTFDGALNGARQMGTPSQCFSSRLRGPRRKRRPKHTLVLPFRTWKCHHKYFALKESKTLDASTCYHCHLFIITQQLVTGWDLSFKANNGMVYISLPLCAYCTTVLGNGWWKRQNLGKKPHLIDKKSSSCHNALQTLPANLWW